MLSVNDCMKKIIEGCQLYFYNSLISREVLLRNYAYFLSHNFKSKHNIAIALHTGSECFDIITVIYTLISNIIFNQESAKNYVDSLSGGEMVLYEKKRCVFEEITTLPGETLRRAKLHSETIYRGTKLNNTDFVREDKWYKILPYRGDSSRLDARGIRSDVKKRNSFLSEVFAMTEDEIPAYTEKSSVLVMNKSRAEEIVDNVIIQYNDKEIKLTEIAPISYCTENEEYPFGGNPGKNEPTLKIVGDISTARSIVTGTWNGNDSWINDILGVSIIGFGPVLRSRSEVVEIMKRRRLKYVFISYNIATIDGETLLDEIDEISVFACTAEFLKQKTFPVFSKNIFTENLDRQVKSIVNKKTMLVQVTDIDWNTYRNIHTQLQHLRYCEETTQAEDFIPLAYSVLNLITTSVFPLQLMESLVANGVLEVESPRERILRLANMVSMFSDKNKNIANSIVTFLESKYKKHFSSSPKEQELFDLLSKHSGEKIAIIVPKAYYANILHNLNVLDYFDDASQLFISTANKFDYSQQYDAIISVGAFYGKNFNPFLCKASSAIYVLANTAEANILKYKKKQADEINKKINKYANISVDLNETAVDEYLDEANEAEVAEITTSLIDTSEYINRIFEFRSLEQLNKYASTHYTTSEISHIATCTDGESIFFTKKYKAFVFDSTKEDVVETAVENLSPGDTIIFKSNNNETKDIVTMLLDKYIYGYDTSDEDIKIAYSKSLHWKDVLRAYREENGLSFKELAKQLGLRGSQKHEVTIQAWLAEDSYIVGPQDDETYNAIAALTQDGDMLSDPKSFRIACEKIRSIRIRILKLIARTIINKYSRKLAAEDDMAKVVSDNIDEISTLVQIETITDVKDKKAPINMINRPVTIN